jgi:xyloglucan-specific exo-beta-1,4-glucanase
MIKFMLLTLLTASALMACASTIPVRLTADEPTLDQIEADIRQKVQQSNTASLVDPTGTSGWSTVDLGGGGYITGIAIHPKIPNVVYIRTDISGWFRWNEASRSWTPLTDFITAYDWNDYGGEGLALDPNDADVIYIAAGNYVQPWAKPGKIYRSKDRGATWEKISPNWNVKIGGGEDRRWAGERLAVSPSDSNVILFGSRLDGLWRTQDGGQTWQQQTFQGLNATYGVQSVVFDANTAGRVYANLFGLGVYRSDDNGSSWTPMVGSPTNGMRLALSNGGTLWVTRADGVSKFQNNTWQNVTPPGHPNSAYSAIAVNPFNDNDVVTAPTELFVTSAPTYRSFDNGQTWQAINWQFKKNIPWTFEDALGLPFWFTAEQASLVFDPHQQNRFWMTNWYSASRSDTMNTARPQLEDLVSNLENTVSTALTTNANGQLLSGIADIAGFYHDQGLNAYPLSQLPKLDGQDYRWNIHTGFATFPPNRNLIYRVGCNCPGNDNGVAKSSDGGKTWNLQHRWDKVNDQQTGPLRIAVSPTDVNNLVITRYNAPPQYSSDGGVTWTDSRGLPAGGNDKFYWGQPLTADGAQANTFYYYDDVAGTVSKSTDGGRTFNVVASDLRNASGTNMHGNLKATPGQVGDLWLSLEWNGLLHSTDGGVTWTKHPKIKYSRVFGFGKSARTDLPPTLIVYGAVDDTLVEGIWMSLDSDQRWINIQNPKIQIGSFPTNLEGSPTEFGRVFVGTSGRGIFTIDLGN